VKSAQSDLTAIREQLAATTRFRGFAAEAVACIGAASLLVLLGQLAWPDRFAASDRQHVLVWGGVLLLAGAIMMVEAIGRTRREHGGMARAMLLGALRSVAPATLAGMVLTLVVLRYAPQICWILPGTWQLLLGVIVLASFAMMPRMIVWPAIWYLASGTITLVLAVRAGALTPILAGGPFVVGHLLIAAILGQTRSQAGNA